MSGKRRKFLVLTEISLLFYTRRRTLSNTTLKQSMVQLLFSVIDRQSQKDEKEKEKISYIYSWHFIRTEMNVVLCTIQSCPVMTDAFFTAKSVSICFFVKRRLASV